MTGVFQARKVSPSPHLAVMSSEGHSVTLRTDMAITAEAAGVSGGPGDTRPDFTVIPQGRRLLCRRPAGGTRTGPSGSHLSLGTNFLGAAGSCLAQQTEAGANTPLRYAGLWPQEAKSKS